MSRFILSPCHLVTLSPRHLVTRPARVILHSVQLGTPTQHRGCTRMHDFPTRRRLYLMRHGEVNYFEQGRPAPPEGVHLNEQGRTQAAAAAAALADISFDRAVTSGLPRTDETAAIVLGDRSLPVIAEPELREIRGGRLAD